MKPDALSFGPGNPWVRWRCRPQRTRGFARAAVAVAAAAVAVAAYGSVTVGPKVAGESDEQRLQRAHTEAERSREEQLRVGRERYEWKLARRRSMLEGMRTELERRREVVPIYAAAASVRLEEPLASTGGSLLNWGLVALGLAGIAAHAIWHRRKPTGKTVRR